MADVVYIFGMPGSIEDKLRTKLENELKKGARVITYSFPIKKWEPDEISKLKENDLPIYLYKI